MAGLMGGLIGAGIGGLLFGGGLFGGLGSFAGFLGFLFQIALIAGLIWLVLRLVRGGFRGREASRTSSSVAATVAPRARQA